MCSVMMTPVQITGVVRWIRLFRYNFDLRQVTVLLLTCAVGVKPLPVSIQRARAVIAWDHE